jgi:hypothetical protein
MTSEKQRDSQLQGEACALDAPNKPRPHSMELRQERRRTTYALV